MWVNRIPYVESPKKRMLSEEQFEWDYDEAN